MGQQVRATKVHALSAGLVDGVGGGNHVHLTVGDQGLTLCGRGLSPGDLRLSPAVVLSNGVDYVSSNVNVQAGHGAVRLAQAKTRLVKLGAQGDLAGFNVCKQAATSAVGGIGAVRTTAGGEGQAQCSGSGSCQYADCTVHQETPCCKTETFEKRLVQDLAKEVLGTVGLGVGEERLRIYVFNNLSVSHEDDAVSHLAGKTHLVGDHDHGHAGRGQL